MARVQLRNSDCTVIFRRRKKGKKSKKYINKIAIKKGILKTLQEDDVKKQTNKENYPQNQEEFSSETSSTQNSAVLGAFEDYNISDDEITFKPAIRDEGLMPDLTHLTAWANRGRSISPTPIQIETIKRSSKSLCNVEIPKKPISQNPVTKKKKKQIYKEYDVEDIVDFKEVHGSKKVFIKWKGYPSEENTWENLSECDTCLQTLAKYFLKLQGLSKFSFPSAVQVWKNNLKPFTDDDLLSATNKYFTEKGHNMPPVDADDVNNTIEILVQIPPYARSRSIIQLIEGDMIIIAAREKRETQMKVLKQWESEINGKMTTECLIRVINSVDFDLPPNDFVYINRSFASFGVNLDEDPPYHCNCEDENGCYGKQCCGFTQDATAAYDKYHHITFGPECAIYECNRFCNCPDTCVNRTVQTGPQIPLAIFKTSNGRGWGVKALEEIKKNQFVCEYVGEIITDTEAQKRYKIEKETKSSYMFDLDFNSEKKSMYTIDARYYGNVARFINHSCRPNLEVYSVFIETHNPYLHRLALFAKEKIKAGQEITFDYKSSGKVMGYTCKCNSKFCRKFIF